MVTRVEAFDSAAAFAALSKRVSSMVIVVLMHQEWHQRCVKQASCWGAGLNLTCCERQQRWTAAGRDSYGGENALRICCMQQMVEAMSISGWSERRKFGREIEGIAACLLPYEEDGRIAEGAFRESVARTEAAGLGCAVNMDTGYANYLTDRERLEVLRWTRETLGEGPRFVGGVFVEGLEGDLVDLYRRGADQVAEKGGTPILFQTTRFHDWEGEKIVELYAEVCAGYDAVLGFELGKVFAPNGMIYSEDVVRGLMGIEQLKGMKHSSLSREEELKRLAMRDEVRPDY
jgi:hypothetical protein